MRELQRLLTRPSCSALCLAGRPAGVPGADAASLRGRRPRPTMPPATQTRRRTTRTPPSPRCRRRLRSRRRPPEPRRRRPRTEIEFQLSFPRDRGGRQRLRQRRVDLDYKRDDYAVLAGDVKIRYQDIDLKADRAEIDLVDQDRHRRGQRHRGPGAAPHGRRHPGVRPRHQDRHPHQRHGPGRARLLLQRPGSWRRSSDDVYTVKDGVFTSCSQEVPDWSFRLSEARGRGRGLRPHPRRLDARQEAAGLLHAVHPLAGQDASARRAC